MFFFNDTATTEIYTLSLHDALPIFVEQALQRELERDRTKTYVVEISPLGLVEMTRQNVTDGPREILTHSCPTCEDRKSTRLNSSHANISYADFCLKKKKKTTHLAVI